MINLNLNIQAHLFVGLNPDLTQTTIDLLQSIICKKNCKTCVTCIQILKNMHEQITFAKPEKQYNLNQIDNIIEKTSLALDQNKKNFIVFEQAELLTTACSNRLLKSIEEPPFGYYFIFLTERPQLILPTIKSRCVTTYLDINQQDIANQLEHSEIGKFFINQNYESYDSNDFLKTIDKSSINEYESVQLVDKLIYFWSNKYKSYIETSNQNESQKVDKKIQILYKALQNSPMPGGNKIFWKNLFLGFLNIN